ncbi:sugar ABC transporter permease [Natronosporangium hydrolyticum]|uniref:Sugar ABC transporter permease n=1 Tax=Natronosporangium hydrolyticum TaxID=2811111 RepID=A0A895YPV4_9ACTN|nr:sugar ABC transporter permease [Natronosporangium hydrolyticum]QSB16766.1 sugar ABC transporter permease [Natronosporangium hydrolyticum]
MNLARTAPPAAAPEGAERRRSDLRWAVARLLGRLSLPRRVWLVAAILIVPALGLRLFTSVYPFLATAWTSLTDESGYRAETTFIGLANYTALLDDRVVRQALLFTVVFAGVSTVLELVLGFALALLLNAAFKLRGLARAVALIPWAIPAIVSALGFRFIFADGFGMVPHLLGTVGLEVDWLTHPIAAKAAVIIANVWRTVPFVAFVILAGLQGVPQELYQAAKVDGAGWFRTIRSVVVPLVTPLVITMGIFMVIFQLGTFDTVLGMTGGGPGTATQVAPYLAYQEAFIGLEHGRASGIAMLLFLIVLGVGVAALRLFRRTEVQL